MTVGAARTGWLLRRWSRVRNRARPGRCGWCGWSLRRANEGGRYVQGIKYAAVQFEMDDGDAGNVDVASLVLNTDVPGVEFEGEAEEVVNGKEGILCRPVNS